MSGQYAKNTAVPVEKSKAEIERILARYGADQFMSGWDADRALVAFRMDGRHVRFLLPMPKRDEPEFTEYTLGRYSGTRKRTESEALKRWEQACRQRWRALALIVKAKLEAIESGISTFEREFLADIMLPDGSTFGEWAEPELERAYANGVMPGLLALPEKAGSGS